MATAGYRAETPFARSTSFNIARSKTPHPVMERRHTADVPKRARTPLPHEEDIRHRRRATSTTARVSEHHRHGTHSRQDAAFKREGDATPRKASYDTAQRDCSWDGFVYDVDFQVRLWMIQEETRRIAAAREAERTRLIQEEVRRIQLKIGMKREFERIRILEERRHAREEEEREWEQRQKAAADKAVASAWAIYERNWAAIASSREPLSFSTIPWPTLNRPSGPSSISFAAISAFVLSEAHSSSKRPRERTKEALRRWHPDRFVRLLQRIPSEERAKVEEAVGVVARCLNELLSKQAE